MAVTFNKRKDLKYTDMCIYIDKNTPLILEKGMYPEIENTIFEYLYHILYALSYKAMFFKNFEDYDNFALSSACQLYMSMRKKLENKGQIIRGKEVVPVKSCLNFIKSILFALKVNYQKETFATIFNPEIDQDTSLLEAQMKESVRVTYRESLEDSFKDMLSRIPQNIKSLLSESPYRNDKYMIKRLYISCILSLISSVTLPFKEREKIDAKVNVNNELKLFNKAYNINSSETILWHLDSKFTDYVTLLVRIIRKKSSDELEENVHSGDLSEDLIESVISSAYSSAEDNNNDKEF